MISVFHGDVIVVDLAPQPGTRDKAVRAAVVIQRDHINPGSVHTIIAPISFHIDTELLSTHVLIPKGEAGIGADAVILAEQLRVIDKRRILRVQGRLPKFLTLHLMNALARLFLEEPADGRADDVWRKGETYHDKVVAIIKEDS